MPRFAAIDVGSNASRLLIVQAKEPERIRPVQSLRVPVRLGHSVFQTGHLDPEILDASVLAMRRFSEAMEEAGVDAYRAVVTASARSAENADVLLGRVREEAGISLEAVDGGEEARLVNLAVSAKMELPGRSLLADLGGGSLELSELEGELTGFTVSLPIGTVRLLEAFLQEGAPVDPRQDRLVREYIDRMLTPHRKVLRHAAWDAVFGTGGNFGAIAQLAPAKGFDVPAIDVEAARELLADMAAMSAVERAEEYGLRSDRADVIVPALYVVVALSDLAKVNELVAPDVGLKDGIVTELVEKHYRIWDYTKETSKILASALTLGRRYHFDERHAVQVSDLACQLFDGTKKLHGLDRPERELLRLAGLLHDIGDFVHSQSHHKHSQYIIDNSDIMGLPAEERRLVALIARYHRRATPSARRHAAFRALDEDARSRVSALSSILRLADALDRGHRAKIKGLRVKVKKSSVVIALDADGDTSLEEWTVGRKAEPFAELFERQVRIQPMRASETPQS